MTEPSEKLLDRRALRLAGFQVLPVDVSADFLAPNPPVTFSLNVNCERDPELLAKRIGFAQVVHGCSAAFGERLLFCGGK